MRPPKPLALLTTEAHVLWSRRGWSGHGATMLSVNLRSGGGPMILRFVSWLADRRMDLGIVNA